MLIGFLQQHEHATSSFPPLLSAMVDCRFAEQGKAFGPHKTFNRLVESLRSRLHDSDHPPRFLSTSER
jgi:hypothetical protein